MKYILKSGSLILITCSLMLQIGHAAAQPATNSYWEILSNAEVTAQITRSNADAEAEYHRLHPTKADFEAMSNAMIHWKPPQTWPEASKGKILAHCAEVLRSAINTNQIKIACSKMTNQPEAALVLKKITTEAISNLDEFANLLTNSELNTSIGQAGYQAGIFNSTNIFRFGFWPDNGLPSLVGDIDKRTPDAQHILIEARFYEDGKLLEFRENTLDNRGISRTKTQLVFNEDGTLRSHWTRPVDKKP